MDLNSISVHKHAKNKLGQYPAILTSQLLDNPYIHHIKREIGRGDENPFGERGSKQKPV